LHEEASNFFHVFHLSQLSLFHLFKLLGEALLECFYNLLATHFDHVLTLLVDVRWNEIIMMAGRDFNLDTLDSISTYEAHLSRFSILVLDR
jgi:hypothetical protein